MITKAACVMGLYWRLGDREIGDWRLTYWSLVTGKRNIMKRIILTLLLLLIIGATAVGGAAAQSDEASVVRGVLFWLDTCPHCHYVIDEVLPPLQAKYGDQLDIVLLELDNDINRERFYAVGEHFGLNPREMGVPLMLVGDRLMGGSEQIPAELPGLIERYLAEGGVEIPPIGGLDTLALQTPVDPDDAPDGRLSGGIAAFVVLAGLVVALAVAGVMLWRSAAGDARPRTDGRLWHAIPVLAVIGLIVAGYLTYVETQAVAAVCGPVGDCNAVQSSEYARFLGVPIGVIGLVGYAAILAAWYLGRAGNATARLTLLGMAAAGVMVSAYLTFVEIFVIEAVCMWCLTSAAVMGLILVAAALGSGQMRDTKYEMRNKRRLRRS